MKGNGNINAPIVVITDEDSKFISAVGALLFTLIEFITNKNQSHSSGSQLKEIGFDLVYRNYSVYFINKPYNFFSEIQQTAPHVQAL